MSPKKVLVTGGSSMVGRSIEAILQTEMFLDGEQWFFASSKDADLTNYDETRRLFATHIPTHVVNLAAKVGGLFANLNNNVEFLRGNMLMNDNVLRCCQEFGVEAYNFQYGSKFTAVIPCNVYGPYDNFNLQSSHVIPGLIHKCYLAKTQGLGLTVAGTGKPLRQFIYSMDLARLYIWALRGYEDTNEPIILSVGEHEEVSIRETVEAITEALDFQGQVEFDTSKSDGIYRKTASNAKLRKLKPDVKFTPFKQAVKATADWFVEHFDSDARK